MDYQGSDNGDVLDQKSLGLPEWSNIYGGKGNDTITLGIANAIAGAGNNTLVGTSAYSTAAYWSSPQGIVADLNAGTVQNGYGGTDTLVNIHSITGSGQNDIIYGTGAFERFAGAGGSDTIVGNGGGDEVDYYFVKSTEAQISYDAVTDTFMVRKNFATGEHGTDTLKGIASIKFSGDGSDNVTITKDDFVGNFRKSTPIQIAPPSNGHVEQIIDGDFNGDGNRDILVVRIDTPSIGKVASPVQILLGDGKGGFADGTAQVFSNAIPSLHYAPRVMVADFNNDGIDDIFAPDFGVDAPPFPGGQNSLFLSRDGHLYDASASLPQRLAQNHGASTGDVNGDGYIDLLVNALNESTGHANELLVNDGTGKQVSSQWRLPAAFTQNTTMPGNTWSAIADVNADGASDLILGTWDPNPSPSTVLLNDGHGNFPGPGIDLPRSGVPLEIVLAIKTINLNNDGLPDLVLSVTNGGDSSQFYQTPYLQLLVNDGSGKFHDETSVRLPQTSSPTAGWYKFIDVVDLNGDGASDLVAQVDYSASSAVFMNDGHGNFSTARRFSSDGAIHAMDVNNDGISEIVSLASDTLRIYANDLPVAGTFRTITGSARDDVIEGGTTNDLIKGGPGNDSIDGGDGIDMAVYGSVRSNFTITKTAAGLSVTDKSGAEGNDVLANVERIRFADTALAFDTDGNAGQAYRLYQAAFNRKPDVGGLGYWIDYLDKGASLTDAATGFFNSPEFKALYGTDPSNATLINKFYQNVLHRAPDPDGFDWWMNELASGHQSPVVALIGFSESPENQSRLIDSIQNGMEFTSRI